MNNIKSPPFVLSVVEGLSKGFSAPYSSPPGGVNASAGQLTMPPTGCKFAAIKVGAGRLS